jgi:SM-20-related protein
MLTGPSVQVLDDLLDDALRDELIETMSWMPMYFLNRKERYGSHDLDVHWYYPIAVSDDGDRADVEPQLAELDDNLQCITRCWNLIKASYPHPLRLYDCLLSANAFGTEGGVHRDIAAAAARPRHHTVLVYCNARWDIAWAGETLVFDDDHEVIAAVRPKPGRVMKIAGDPLHVGRSVSRTCPSDRRVLVFKFWALPVD